MGKDSPEPIPEVSETGICLDDKIQEISGYDRKTAEKCVHALLESYEDEETELEILESLFYLGLGQPKLAERFEVRIPDIGRHLAAAETHFATPEDLAAYVRGAAAGAEAAKAADDDPEEPVARSDASLERLPMRSPVLPVLGRSPAATC